MTDLALSVAVLGTVVAGVLTLRLLVRLRERLSRVEELLEHITAVPPTHRPAAGQTPLKPPVSSEIVRFRRGQA